MTIISDTATDPIPQSHSSPVSHSSPDQPLAWEKCACLSCGQHLEYPVKIRFTRFPCPKCGHKVRLIPLFLDMDAPATPNQIYTLASVVLGGLLYYRLLDGGALDFWDIDAVGLLSGVMMSSFAYLFPSVLAANKKHVNSAAICTLNVLLGWTFFGWCAALIWGLTKSRPNYA